MREQPMRFSTIFAARHFLESATSRASFVTRNGYVGRRDSYQKEKLVWPTKATVVYVPHTLFEQGTATQEVALCPLAL